MCVLPGKPVGIMFLVEAALGSEASITRDDPSLKAPPKGHDCVVARGRRVSMACVVAVHGMCLALHGMCLALT